MILRRGKQGDWAILRKGSGLQINHSESSGFCINLVAQPVIIEIGVPSDAEGEVICERLEMELVKLEGDLCIPIDQILLQQVKADLAIQQKPRVLIGILSAIKYGIKSQTFKIDNYNENEAVKEALAIIKKLFSKQSK